MKANHNYARWWCVCHPVVSNTSKLLKWKQITTIRKNHDTTRSCFQYVKVTKMKANHNIKIPNLPSGRVVSNTSKLLKWKQITTSCCFITQHNCCFQYVKVTKMKANHNFKPANSSVWTVVSNTSKLLKWKQITTGTVIFGNDGVLFPIRQSY